MLRLERLGVAPALLDDRTGLVVGLARAFAWYSASSALASAFAFSAPSIWSRMPCSRACRPVRIGFHAVFVRTTSSSTKATTVAAATNQSASEQLRLRVRVPRGAGRRRRTERRRRARA